MSPVSSPPPLHEVTHTEVVAVRRRSFSMTDLVVAGAVVVLLFLIVRVGRDTIVDFTPTQIDKVDSAPENLPYYSGRTLLRMFAGLLAAYVFSIIYAYAAARVPRAGRILIPALDILQSIPVLGFLSITVTGFIALFEGSYLGLEAASVFAIFTAQAWNITFSFYDSLVTQPRELDELARMTGMSRWRRFIRIDLPNGAIGLIWNGMMSMGGAWFFLVESEVISIAATKHALPGLGSYAGDAVSEGNLGHMAWGVLAMVVVVVGVNVLFWGPLVAWSEKFKHDFGSGSTAATSPVLTLLRASTLTTRIGLWTKPTRERANALGDRLTGIPGRGGAGSGSDQAGTSAVISQVKRLTPSSERGKDRVFNVLATVAIGVGLWRLLAYVTEEDGWAIFWPPLWQGLLTLARVAAVLAVATMVWVPVGVIIGRNPVWRRRAQPIVQVLASFPAVFLFPFVVWIFLRTGTSIGIGGTILMALGSQWYILFNVIAGAQAIPSEMEEAMCDFGVSGWLRWKRLLLPAVFPSYVTGAITASGGAWNASIVSEVVTFSGTTLTATGLGAYIANATEVGDFRQTLCGVVIMAIYVVGLNRVLWQPIYRLTEKRFSIA